MSEESQNTPKVPFEEDEYVQFARERMESRMSLRRQSASRRSFRSLLFTIIAVAVMIWLYNNYFKVEPPSKPKVDTSPSIIVGGKRFVPLDTYHLAPNVDVSPPNKK